MEWLDNIIFDRNLRKNGTPGERILWVEYFQPKNRENRNKNKPRFLRQRRINKIQKTVDFYCAKLNLCIEIDGSSHDWETGQRNDLIRQEKLEDLGLNVLRILERDVYYNPHGVYYQLEDIICKLEKEKGFI